MSRPRNLLGTVALATFTAVALAVPLTAGPTAGAETAAAPIEEYVALGDSWSADVVLADTNGLPDSTHAPVDCAQSHTNYPKLLARELGITNFRDATCGSAKTDDFYAPQEDLPLGGTNPAQFDRLTATTDLVTVGIGGNDAGIAGAAMDCLGATARTTRPSRPAPIRPAASRWAVARTSTHPTAARTGSRSRSRPPSPSWSPRLRRSTGAAPRPGC